MKVIVLELSDHEHDSIAAEAQSDQMSMERWIVDAAIDKVQGRWSRREIARRTGEAA